MARSYSVRESAIQKASANNDLELSILKSRIQSKIDNERLSQTKTAAQFKEKADKGIGFASAYAKELERIEALQKDPNARFKNERDDSNSPFAMERQEQEIKGQDYETAVVFDRYGRFISKSENGKNLETSVDALENQLAGGTITHNHPKHGSPLSVGDVRTLLENSLFSMRAIAREDGSVSEIRHKEQLPENADRDYYLGKYGMKLADTIENLNESWQATIQDASAGAFYKVKKEDPESFKRLMSAGNGEGFRLEDPSIQDIVNKYFRPSIEKQWMEFVAGELEQFGFEYYHNGKKV